jgi:hypothetical protein
MPFPNRATQFKPGQSGNPDGRPVDPITPLLRQALDRTEADGRTVAEIVVEALIGEAIGGNLKALQIILDRTEGKPRQAVSLEGNGDALPIQWIEVRYENDWRSAPDAVERANEDAAGPPVKSYRKGSTPNDL